jgi:hypothetical protein
MENPILEGLARNMGNPQEALETKQRMDANVRFALDHLEEWRQHHPNKWIAVYDAQVVASESSKTGLLKTLHKKKLPLREVYVDFVSEEKAALILYS